MCTQAIAIRHARRVHVMPEEGPIVNSPPPQAWPPQGPPPQGWPPPGWPPQGPTPPQAQPPQWPSPAPHGHPRQWPPPQGQPWQWPPTGPPTPPPSKNTGLLIGIGAAVALIVVFVLAFVVPNILGSESSNGGSDVSDEQRAANATTAASLSDFDVVCGTGSVSNAAPYEKPYSIAAFHQGTAENDWDAVTLDNQADYVADRSNLTSINVVACLTRKDGTEVKSGTCEFGSGGEQVAADHYAVEYDLELREAKTGKAITNLGTVNGPATRCPFIAYFDENDPEIFGSPDPAAVEDKLAEFAAQ
ncbi:hypothetical protein [Mycobacterium deserti]|uniref:Uncharacterized protein n=1 Tax=Mycobacterium deserti TaxID=2978347 RepID=A0ABT2MK43_9MYCO|nr:hypothetical protein [Mycobacterium deserti]MCT7661351.1 hypothetical protein [Mycobacterium deserti]